MNKQEIRYLQVINAMKKEGIRIAAERIADYPDYSCVSILYGVRIAYEKFQKKYPKLLRGFTVKHRERLQQQCEKEYSEMFAPYAKTTGAWLNYEEDGKSCKQEWGVFESSEEGQAWRESALCFYLAMVEDNEFPYTQALIGE